MPPAFAFRAIVLAVDLQVLLLYNIEQRGIVPRVSAKGPCLGICRGKTSA